MADERRKHERANLKRDDIPGSFFIDADGESFQFTNVNDVSISGMGIDTPFPLEKGAAIGLRYIADDFQLRLNGTVAWCETGAEEGSHRIGVQFDPANMNDNVMFFMTLREYVDDFE